MEINRKGEEVRDGPETRVFLLVFSASLVFFCQPPRIRSRVGSRRLLGGGPFGEAPRAGLTRGRLELRLLVTNVLVADLFEEELRKLLRLPVHHEVLLHLHLSHQEVVSDDLHLKRREERRVVLQHPLVDATVRLHEKQGLHVDGGPELIVEKLGVHGDRRSLVVPSPDVREDAVRRDFLRPRDAAPVLDTLAEPRLHDLLGPHLTCVALEVPALEGLLHDLLQRRETSLRGRPVPTPLATGTLPQKARETERVPRDDLEAIEAGLVLLAQSHRVDRRSPGRLARHRLVVVVEHGTGGVLLPLLGGTLVQRREVRAEKNIRDVL
eukprot:Rhum_TRINITY_DN23138_c0_g1::Rhum_TRINITY_DN23138_c0_g1_i1::g.177140::m.177140